jgi:hypothetical protein
MTQTTTIQILREAADIMHQMWEAASQHMPPSLEETACEMVNQLRKEANKLEAGNAEPR